MGGGIEVRRGHTSVVETVERELAEVAPNESEREAVDQVAVEDAPPQESNSTAAESNAVLASKRACSGRTKAIEGAFILSSALTKLMNNDFLVDKILARVHTPCFDSEKQRLDRSQTLSANAWRWLGLHPGKSKGGRRNSGRR